MMTDGSLQCCSHCSNGSLLGHAGQLHSHSHFRLISVEIVESLVLLVTAGVTCDVCWHKAGLARVFVDYYKLVISSHQYPGAGLGWTWQLQSFNYVNGPPEQDIKY